MFGGRGFGSGRFGSGKLRLSRSDSAKSSTSTPEQVQSLLEDACIASELGDECFSAWPDNPVVLTPNPRAGNQVVSGGEGPSGKWHRVNPQLQNAGAEAIEFETDLFKGKIVLWMDGLKSTPKEFFTGKKRLTWVAFQGEFKREVPVDEVVAGQELPRPLHALPAAWFVENVLLKMARAISPSMQVGHLSSPSFLAPILALAQVANVSPLGMEPDLATAEEDLKMFNPQLVGKKGVPMPANTRKAYFSKPANRKGQMFRPGVVWTFHIWQHLVDMSSYRLDFIYTYNLVRHLAGQPLLVMAKHTPHVGPSSYLYNFQVWHKALADDTVKAAAAIESHNKRSMEKQHPDEDAAVSKSVVTQN